MTTPRDNRAAVRDQRRLQVPTIALGRADLIRSRSPSPVVPGHFNFPPPPQPEPQQFDNATALVEMATDEQLAAIRDELRLEMRRELRAETMAAAAGTPDAIRRKPEIPAFDKDHIEIWIRRTEHAYTRAGVTSVDDKFAWLETKFPVGNNPRIDEFLYGEANDTNWTAFLNYLRKEYGMTKQQRASTVLDGFKRDGRRPTQYIAALEEKTKDLSMEDIKKEMLLRELPTDVQRMLQERIETLSLKEAAAVADNFFDAEGRPKHSAGPQNINAVTDNFQNLTTFTEPFKDEDEGVNAIGRFPQRQPGAQTRNFKGNAPQHKKGWHAQTANQSKPAAPKGQKPKNTIETGMNLCTKHLRFGDKAYSCEVGCSRFDEKRFPGNGQAGRR